MPEIEDWLAENYRALQAESGRAWDHLADDMPDADVAAWMRSQASGDKATPKARKAAPKSEA